MKPSPNSGLKEPVKECHLVVGFFFGSRGGTQGGVPGEAGKDSVKMVESRNQLMIKNLGLFPPSHPIGILAHLTVTLTEDDGERGVHLEDHPS